MSRKSQAKNNLIQLLTDDINNPNDGKENDIIAIDALVPYPNHPFKLYEGDRFSDMVRSITEMGILLPIIVRPIEPDNGQYEILSGHNRVNAAKVAGLDEVPVIIKRDLTDAEAELIVTETNLVQRSFADLLHSERAIALKRHLDAIKHQGKRTDLINEINELLNADKARNTGENSSSNLIDEKLSSGENPTSNLIDEKLLSVEKTGAKYGLSSASVTRYIRINFLNDDLKNQVDNDKIGIYPAVSLSYLSPEEQTELSMILSENKYRVDMKKAETLRSYSESKKLTRENMIQILSGELNKKPKTKNPATFKIRYKIYAKYFNEAMKQDEVESIIDKALAKYFEDEKSSIN